jgi:putative ABC transport system permease protein
MTKPSVNIYRRGVFFHHPSSAINRFMPLPKFQAQSTIASLEIFSMASDALWSNKLRSGLTMLGVIIGISSVIGITSIGQGVQKSTEENIRALGTDVLQVMAGASRDGNISQGVGSTSTLTWEDAKAIAAQAPSARVVSAFLQRNAQVVYGNENTSTTVYGTDLNFPTARNTKTEHGRYFDVEELEAAKQVTVIGPTVQRTLFGNKKDVLGQKIRIQGEAYEVIGITPRSRRCCLYSPHHYVCPSGGQ